MFVVRSLCLAGVFGETVSFQTLDRLERELPGFHDRFGNITDLDNELFNEMATHYNIKYVGGTPVRVPWLADEVLSVLTSSPITLRRISLNDLCIEVGKFRSTDMAVNLALREVQLAAILWPDEKAIPTQILVNLQHLLRGRQKLAEVIQAALKHSKSPTEWGGNFEIYLNRIDTASVKYREWDLNWDVPDFGGGHFYEQGFFSAVVAMSAASKLKISSESVMLLRLVIGGWDDYIGFISESYGKIPDTSEIPGIMKGIHDLLIDTLIITVADCFESSESVDKPTPKPKLLTNSISTHIASTIAGTTERRVSPRGCLK